MITVDIRKADKVMGTHSLFLSFQYDETVLGVIRTLSPRYWHAEQKEWELPVNKLTDIVGQLSNCEIHIIGDLNALKERKVPNIDFKFKTKPFDHQIDGFNYGLTHDAWLLGDEQGLGKTKAVIDIAVAKKQMYGYKHCLIVCGVNGLKWNWVKEVHTHSDEEAYILGQKVNTKGRTVIGSNADKLADIQRIDELPYFVITNVESLRDDKIAGALKKCCADEIINIIAIDEIHKCKDATSQQGKGILKLNAETKIAMTGTPLMNTPLDLYIILKWLGYENHSFYAFKNHYCVMGGYGNYQIIGYQNTNELRELLNDMMLRRLKKDVLDLPEKLYVDEYVDMSKEQWGIYNEVLDDLRMNIDKIANTPNPLAQLIRLRQATGYTGILSTEVAVSAKLDRMVELVEEAVANKTKVIVFSNWTQITDEVIKRLRCYNPAVITGQTSDADRPMQEAKFKDDDTCKVIIGTTGAMGTGLTLNSGTVEIFLDHPWTRAMYDQAVDRAHRIGQSSNITVYNLLCKDTIDERVWNIVKGKGELSDALIDGKTQEDKRQMLNYLLG